jgi:hypothetical protein
LLGSKQTEHDADILRKRQRRSESARITIPECKNPKRREACLQDWQRFLRTYFAKQYWRPFGRHHVAMGDAIVDCARDGYNQGIAAPRGCGKTEITKGLLVYVTFAGLVRFALAVAATSSLASSIFKDFRKKIAFNEMLLEDFPEICWPVRALEGAPQRAAKQHVDGALTNIVWSATELNFPNVAGSAYGGIKMQYYGLDSAFRGINIDGDRPDFVLVDDPETKESAKSLLQIEEREQIIDRDITGLKTEGGKLAVVVLTTIQNSYCLSYKITDREQKPAFNGLRFGAVIKWPTNMELWDTYIDKRKAAQKQRDRTAIEAVRFYLSNRNAMHDGAEMLSESYKELFTKDGFQLVYSSLQEAFNKIADTSFDAYRSEYQNDPEVEDVVEKSKLTALKVMQTYSGLEQSQMPDDLLATTVGIDIGKYRSHWVKNAFDIKAAGMVTDYGSIETHGLNQSSSDEAIELAIMRSLEQFAETDVFQKDKPLLVLVDSGDYTNAVYEACARLGPPFYPSKGWSETQYRKPKQSTESIVVFQNAHAAVVETKCGLMWLYHVNTESWKNQVQQRFTLDPFCNEERVTGSLSIFLPPALDRKFHAQFGRHIVSEGEEMIPKDGKPYKRQWTVYDRKNNHWLDAQALALAASNCVGVDYIHKPVEKPVSQQMRPKSRYFSDPFGRPFFITQR